MLPGNNLQIIGYCGKFHQPNANRFSTARQKPVWGGGEGGHSSLNRVKTIVNKFAISNHTALIFRVHALRSYLKLICEYELYNLPDKNISGAKDHGENYIKVRPPLVRLLLRNHLL